MNISNHNQNPAAPAPVLPGVMHDDLSDQWKNDYLASRHLYNQLVERLPDANFAALYRVVNNEFDRRSAKVGK